MNKPNIRVVQLKIRKGEILECNWSKKELKSILDMHLKLVADTVVARIKGDWDADIIATDLGEAHLIKLADTLTEGIIKQFPKKF